MQISVCKTEYSIYLFLAHKQISFCIDRLTVCAISISIISNIQKVYSKKGYYILVYFYLNKDHHVFLHFKLILTFLYSSYINSGLNKFYKIILNYLFFIFLIYLIKMNHKFVQSTTSTVSLKLIHMK